MIMQVLCNINNAAQARHECNRTPQLDKCDVEQERSTYVRQKHPGMLWLSKMSRKFFYNLALLYRIRHVQ